MKNRALYWWYLIIGVNFYLLFTTTIQFYIPHFRGDRILIYPFNLATENNLAVWWSGICLFATALLAYERCCCSEDHLKKAWLCLAVLLLGLSKDEICSLHERINGWRNLLPYAICAFSLLSYSIIVLFREKTTRKTAIIIGCAFLLFGSVALQEHLEHMLVWPEWALGIRVGVEEGTELAGVFLLFVGIVPLRKSLPQNGLIQIIPNVTWMKHLQALLLMEFIVHTAASFFFPAFFDIHQRRYGNPLVWYPSAVFFLLFAASFWNAVHSAGKEKKYLTIFSGAFLLFSAGVMYNPILLIPKLRAAIPESIQEFLFLLAILMTIFAYKLWQKLRISTRSIAFSALLLSSFGLYFIVNTDSIHYLLYGIFAYSSALLFFLIPANPETIVQPRSDIQESRPLHSLQFCSSSRKLKILTGGI